MVPSPIVSSAVVSLAVPMSSSTASPASISTYSSATLVVTTSRNASGVILETFSLFSSLPIELRRKVWGVTFADRQHVALEHVCYPQADEDAMYAWKRENEAALPVALYVNHESREEALRVNTIMFRADVVSPVKFGGLHPICSADGDVFWVNFLTMMNSTGELYDWLTALEVNQPGFLATVQKLEVRGTFTMAFFVPQFNLNKFKSLAAGDLRKMYCGWLLLFPALREVVFTGKNGDSDWDNDLGKASLEKLRLWIVKFLASAKATKVAIKVTFRPFKTFQEVLEEEFPKKLDEAPHVGQVEG